MAEETKPVEVPVAETTAAPAAEPTAETAPAVVEPVAAEPAAVAATEATPAEPAVEAAPAAEAPAAEETKVEEPPKPIEEGVLEAKGSTFPKKFLYSKKYFWFGSDAVDPKELSTYLKAEKVTEVGHSVAAWAAETGKGLLFFSEKPGEKSTPHGAIQLAEAADPTAEGTNKFHLTTKGQKHTFKAGSTAERDNWVAQIKIKIEEAKALVETVKESETYKKTLESLKPAPPAKKEEKKEEPPKEEAAAAPVAAAAAAAVPAVAAEEAPKEEKEEPKRRSASRKRASIFGSFMGSKKSEKAEEKKEDDKPAETEAAKDAAAPAEAAPVETTAAVPEVTAAEAVVTGAAPAAEAEAPAETKEAAKPAPTKRGSIFGNLSFGKKKEEKKVEETPAEAALVSETAPVIPAVETTEPLSTDVAETPAAPAETTEAAPATNGETKKEVKSDKRKSSLPFAFGKLRATIKGKGKDKSAAEKSEKAEEKPAEAEAAKDAEPAVAADEAPKPAEPEVVAPAVEDVPAEKPIATTPAVTAAA